MMYEPCPCGNYQKLRGNRFCPDCTSLAQKKAKTNGIQTSKQQQALNRQMAKAKKEIQQEREAICKGCGRRPGGYIVLDPSHIISRDYCRDYKRMDLYADKRNLTEHCRDIRDGSGCHQKWESNAERHTLLDYRPNMTFIKQEIPKLALVLLMNEERALKQVS